MTNPVTTITVCSRHLSYGWGAHNVAPEICTFSLHLCYLTGVTQHCTFTVLTWRSLMANSERCCRSDITLCSVVLTGDCVSCFSGVCWDPVGRCQGNACSPKPWLFDRFGSQQAEGIVGWLCSWVGMVQAFNMTVISLSFYMYVCDYVITYVNAFYWDFSILR